MNNRKTAVVLDCIPGLDSYSAFVLYVGSNGWKLNSYIEAHTDFECTCILTNTIAKKDKLILIHSTCESVRILEKHYDKILNKIMKSSNVCRNYKNPSKSLHVAMYKNLYLYMFRYYNYLFIGYCPKKDAFELMDVLRELKVASQIIAHTD